MQRFFMIVSPLKKLNIVHSKFHRWHAIHKNFSSFNFFSKPGSRVREPGL